MLVTRMMHVRRCWELLSGPLHSTQWSLKHMWSGLACACTRVHLSAGQRLREGGVECVRSVCNKAVALPRRMHTVWLLKTMRICEQLVVALA